MSEPTQTIRSQTSEMKANRPQSVEIEVNSIGSELRQLAMNSDKLNGLIRGVAEIVCRETECLAVWIGQRDPASGTMQIHPLTDASATSVAEIAGPKLPTLLERTEETGDLGSIQISENHSIAASAVGVQVDKFEMVLAGCFVDSNQSSTRHQWILTMGAQVIEHWIKGNELQRSQTQSKFLGDALSLCGLLDRSTSKQEAANYFVNHLRRLLSMSQVVYCDGATPLKAKLLAISEVEQFDPHSESSRVILSAACLGITADEAIIYSPTTKTANAVQTLALEAYCKANRFTSCVCVPTKDHEGVPTGSVLVASRENAFSELQLTQLQQFASINGAHLEVVRRANLGAKDLVAEQIKRIPSKNWFRTAMKAAGCIALLMCVPIPYRVACDCEIQPVTRRFVSAPYTGPLERAVVRPGQVVSKDQVLAYMDGQQLRHELTGVEAEHQAARRRHSSSLAQGEVAQSQIARSEMKKLETQLKSLKDQLSRLEIRSPYNGIVISGDLDKAQGATMEIGQTLFEVAPLDNMLAEVAIPESEIQHVKDTNSVAIKLNAFPYRTFYGEVNTIHPSAEVLNDESVFVADVKLTDDESVIRPGMKGTAKVKTSWRPIGWNLFHNAWESVRCWTIW